MKNKKHKKYINDYENQKRKHLEKLATRSLKLDERNQKLKDKKIKGDFLDKF